jgi:hypothetical protein
MNTKTEYKTDKLPIAAHLVAMGAELPTCEEKRGRCEFTFEDSEGNVEYTALEYDIVDEHAAMVSAPRFYNAIRNLHRLLKEARERKS